MAENSKIEWTDSTFNPWSGCTKVSPGCANCYAEALSKRNPKTLGVWGAGQPRQRMSEAYWQQPLKWNRFAEVAMKIYGGEYAAADYGGDALPGKPVRPRVFCASLADWLDDEVPVEWLADLLDLIRRTPNLDWLLLSKRPQNWFARISAALAHAEPRDHLLKTAAMIALWGLGTPPANVWLGTTVEDQTRADERIPLLLSIPARVRFLSCEPLIGPVDLRLNECRHEDAHVEPDTNAVVCRECEEQAHVDWVICGGESGPGARPMHPDWARALRDQCAGASVPFLFKQWGEWVPDDGQGTKGEWHGFRDGQMLKRVGKKAAGRLLDGREHNEFPTVEVPA